MRWFCSAALFGALAFAAVNPQLLQVHSVYLLPMSSGMDQFLANRLTRAGNMQVVTDPLAADAIITDRVGEGLEDKLKELYPPPPKEEDEDEDADTRKKPAAQQQDKLRVSSFGRGKGTVFIVDRRTRGVLWSIYEKPKNTSAGEMDRTASRIVDHLKHDLKPAAPPSK